MRDLKNVFMVKFLKRSKGIPRAVLIYFIKELADLASRGGTEL
jgi:hypothetical protein